MGEPCSSLTLLVLVYLTCGGMPSQRGWGQIPGLVRSTSWFVLQAYDTGFRNNDDLLFSLPLAVTSQNSTHQRKSTKKHPRRKPTSPSSSPFLFCVVLCRSQPTGELPLTSLAPASSLIRCAPDAHARPLLLGFCTTPYGVPSLIDPVLAIWAHSLRNIVSSITGIKSRATGPCGSDSAVIQARGRKRN